MRKLFLICVLAPVLWAVQRTVLVEAFSSTTCPHCPFANAATEWLADTFGEYVSVIQYMDGLSGSEASYRSNFYGVSGVPDVWFVGLEHELGSTDDTTADYNRFEPHVYYWLGSSTQMALEDVVATTNGSTGTVHCKVRLTSNIPGTDPDPRVLCVITERGVYGDGRYNRYIMRDIISSPTGDPLTASSPGDTQSFTWNFSLSGWNPDSLEAVIFVQSYGSGLVFQSKQVRFWPEDVAENSRGAGDLELWVAGRAVLVNIPERAGVQIEVYDVAGRQEDRVFAGELGPGEHSFGLPGLAPGMHIVLLKTPWGTRVARFSQR